MYIEDTLFAEIIKIDANTLRSYNSYGSGR